MTGGDPQLEKAVALVMDSLKKNPLPTAKRPAFPNYHNTTPAKVGIPRKRAQRNFEWGESAPARRAGQEPSSIQILAAVTRQMNTPTKKYRSWAAESLSGAGR